MTMANLCYVISHLEEEEARIALLDFRPVQGSPFSSVFVPLFPNNSRRFFFIRNTLVCRVQLYDIASE